MHVVKRCVQDFDEVWETDVAEFVTETEAEAFADAEDRAAPFSDVWHRVVEE